MTKTMLCSFQPIGIPQLLQYPMLLLRGGEPIYYHGSHE